MPEQHAGDVTAELAGAESWPPWLEDMTPEQRVQEIVLAVESKAHRSAGRHCTVADAEQLLLRLLAEVREPAVRSAEHGQLAQAVAALRRLALGEPIASERDRAAGVSVLAAELAARQMHAAGTLETIARLGKPVAPGHAEARAEVLAEIAADWTIDPSTGRSNSSSQFEAMVREVERILRSALRGVISPGVSAGAAGIIVARLAHVHKLAPAGAVVPARAVTDAAEPAASAAAGPGAGESPSQAALRLLEAASDVISSARGIAATRDRSDPWRIAAGEWQAQWQALKREHAPLVDPAGRVMCGKFSRSGHLRCNDRPAGHPGRHYDRSDAGVIGWDDDGPLGAPAITWQDEPSGRCPSRIAGHRCAFLGNHEHPCGAQVPVRDAAGSIDYYVTWGVMGSSRQPVPSSVTDIRAGADADFAEARHRIAEALALACRCMTTDGAHHKTWFVDQMVRALADDYAGFTADAGDWDTGVAP